MVAAERQEALKRLDVLVGEWVVEAEFPGLEVPPGRSVFEWTLDGRFLVQRTEAPNPAPDSMAIIAVDPETGGYTQHYYVRRAGSRPARSRCAVRRTRAPRPRRSPARPRCRSCSRCCA